MPYHIRVRASALIIKDDAILLIEYTDEQGIHYNLPAGGTEPGESIREAAQREAWEEARADIDVGPLALVYEYAPHANDFVFGRRHALDMIFSATLRPGCTPYMPSPPDDPQQTAVLWVPLAELESYRLYPTVTPWILQYVQGQAVDEMFIEQVDLPL